MVAVDTLVTEVEEVQVVLHPSVHTVQQVVDKVVKPITHIREVLADQHLEGILTYLVVEEKCHTVQTEKVDQVQVSGINQVVHITMPITKKRLLMVSGDLEEVMVTIHKTVLHMATAMAVQAVLSSTIIHNHESIIN